MAQNGTLQRLRKAAGLTQRQLGELVGVTEITIRKWESGERDPRLRYVRPLAKALGCQPGQLL